MRLLIVSLAFSLAVLPVQSHAQAPRATAPGSAQQGGEGPLYALGVRLAQQLSQFGLSPAELEVVKKGLSDAVAGRKLRFDPAAQETALQKLAEQRLARTTAANKKAGQAFLAKAATEKGAQKMASGLVFTSLKEGTGATPTQADYVLANLEGRLVDGTVFDSSARRGQALQIPVAQAIPCMAEAFSKMKVGGKARFVCPSALAYGDPGRPPIIPPGATLVFEMEIVQVGKVPPGQQGPHGGQNPHGGMPPGSKPSKKS